jgi:AcrR family transcriptional regulator/DNA-binding MarR family transcriptional regulator
VPAEAKLASGGRLTGRLDLAALPSRRGDILVSHAQRLRMLSSALAIVSEHGYAQMSVARVTGRAGVSRRTFYDLFEDREDCFLAIFEEGVDRAVGLVVEAYGRGRNWREKIRSALRALLAFLDEEPALRSLRVVDALNAGPRVLEHRGEVLERCSTALQQGATKSGREIPEIIGEGVVGAVFSVIHTRLLQKRPGPLIELLNPLVGMIVLTYLGPAAAQREIERPTPAASATAASDGQDQSPARDPLDGLPMRITYRTLRVLTVIAEQPCASNRAVADQAGVADQGQISRLLARLERLGLIHNTGHGQPSGEPNAWNLTPLGQDIQQAIHAHPGRAGRQSDGTGAPR